MNQDFAIIQETLDEMNMTPAQIQAFARAAVAVVAAHDDGDDVALHDAILQLGREMEKSGQEDEYNEVPF